MNSPISVTKANWNAFKGVLRPALGFRRHHITIWLNQMLWVTNMASQLRAAQKTLSSLLRPAAENTATWKTMWVLSRNVVCLITQWRVRLWSHTRLTFFSMNLCNSRRKSRLSLVSRAAAACQVFLQRGNDKNKLGDVMPLPNGPCDGMQLEWRK